MGNMTTVIMQHNNKILNPRPPIPDKSCNFRKKSDGPLNGAYLTDNLVYKAEGKAPGLETKIYLEMIEGPYKTRFNNHKLTIKHEKQASVQHHLNTSGTLRQQTQLTQLTGQH